MTNTTSDARLDIEVLKQFRIIIKSIRRHFLSVEQACGISGAQLWALSKIGESTLTVSQLAHEMAIHQSTASNLVEKLVDKQLAIKRRQAEDQRSVSLELTAQGREILDRAPQPFQGLLPDALGKMPYTQLRTLHGLLDDLLKRMSELESEAGSSLLSE